MARPPEDPTEDPGGRPDAPEAIPDAVAIERALPPRKRNYLELDETIAPVVLAVVRVGAGKRAAAAQAGVHRETVRRWEREGRAALARAHAGEELSERDQRLARFAIDLEAAKENPRVYLLGLIRKAARGDWRAGAWLLERMFPDEFGPHVLLRKMTEKPEGPRVDLSKLSTSELMELRRLRAKASVPEDRVIDVEAEPDEDPPE